MSNIANSELQIISENVAKSLHNKSNLFDNDIEQLLFDGKHIKAFQIRPVNNNYNNSNHVFVDVGYIVSEDFYKSNSRNLKSFFKETVDGKDVYYRRVITLQASQPKEGNNEFVKYLHDYYYLLDETIEKTGIEAIFYSRGNSISFLEMPNFVLKEITNSNGKETHSINYDNAKNNEINVIVDNSDKINKVFNEKSEEIVSDVEIYLSLFNDGKNNTSSTFKDFSDYMIESKKAKKVDFVLQKKDIAKIIIEDKLNNSISNTEKEIIIDIAKEIESKDIELFYKDFISTLQDKGLQDFISVNNAEELYDKIGSKYRISMDKSGFNRMKIYSLVEKTYNIFNSIQWDELDKETKRKYGLLFYYITMNISKLEIYDIEKTLDIYSFYSNMICELIKPSIVSNDFTDEKIVYQTHSNDSMPSQISDVRNFMININCLKTDIIQSVYEHNQQEISNVDYTEAINIAKSKNFINDNLTPQEEEETISIVSKDIIKTLAKSNKINNRNINYSYQNGNFSNISIIDNVISMMKKTIRNNEYNDNLNIYSSLIFDIWRKSFLANPNRIYDNVNNEAIFYNYLSNPLSKELVEALFNEQMANIVSKKKTQIYSDFCEFYDSFIDEPGFSSKEDKNYQNYYSSYTFFTFVSILYALDNILGLNIEKSSWEKLIKETHLSIKEISNANSGFSSSYLSLTNPIETPLFSLVIDFISAKELEKVNWIVKNAHDIHSYMYGDDSSSAKIILNITNNDNYRNYARKSNLAFKSYLILINYLRNDNHINNIMNGNINLNLSYNIEIVPKIIELNNKNK